MMPCARLSFPILSAVALTGLVAIPAQSDAQPEPASRDWIVVYKDHVSRERADRNVLAAARWTYDIIPGLAATLTDDEVAALRANPNVALVEPDTMMHAFGASSQIVPYGIDLVHARDVWPTTRGAGAIVAVLDTGIDLNHPDKGNVVASASFINGQQVQDGSGHGTHVSGTVCAMDNSFGVVGVAPDADLLIGKVLSNNGSGATSGIIAGIDWAVMNGADVINMSLGGGFFSSSLQTACDNAVAMGVTVVAAAGNDNSSAPHYPASYPSVISVMSLDEFKQKADTSNFGSEIDLGAPGVNVLSTVPVGTGLFGAAVWSGVGHDANPIDGTTFGTTSGAVYDCGLGTGLPGDSCPSAVAGNVAFIRRGDISFADKIAHAESMGAVGVIIANNIPGNFFGTIGAGMTPLVCVSVSQADGDDLQALIPGGISSEVTADTSDYAKFGGTSMASPHVAGVAALLRSAAPGASVAEIRSAMETTAEDLGAPGRDDIFGHGLVDAAAALAVLAPPCTGDANGDNVVNFADVNAVVSNWLADYGVGTGPGDANGDGLVNFDDIGAIVSNWLGTC